MIQIRSELKKKVVQFFLTNERESVYINDLARRLNADPKNLYRILVQLEQEGVLKSVFQGNERYFSSLRETSLYKAYKKLFYQTNGVDILLAQALKGFAVDEAYIFGSFVNTGFSPLSDIDLLVVTGQKKLEIEKAIKKVANDLGRDINTVYMTKDSFLEKKKNKDTFIRSIFSKKIIKVC